MREGVGVCVCTCAHGGMCEHVCVCAQGHVCECVCVLNAKMVTTLSMC